MKLPALNRVYQGDCVEIMKGWPDGFVDMIWTDPPYGHGNHDGDLNARLNAHRGLEDKPIANDDADGMRRVVDAMLTQAARVLKPDCCCCCCCCCGGGGPKPTFAWLADRMDKGGLSFFHSVIWDKVNPGLGWRYRRQHEMVMVAHRRGGAIISGYASALYDEELYPDWRRVTKEVLADGARPRTEVLWLNKAAESAQGRLF